MTDVDIADIESRELERLFLELDGLPAALEREERAASLFRSKVASAIKRARLKSAEKCWQFSESRSNPSNVDNHENFTETSHIDEAAVYPHSNAPIVMDDAEAQSEGGVRSSSPTTQAPTNSPQAPSSIDLLIQRQRLIDEARDTYRPSEAYLKGLETKKLNRQKAEEKEAQEQARRVRDRRCVDPSLKVWRHLGEERQNQRRFEVLAADGAMAVTLLIHPRIIAKAEAKPNPLQWLADRIQKAMNKHLGRDPDIWLVAERNDAGKLHLHGVIGIGLDESQKAQEAFRDALGHWTTPREQFSQTPLYGDDWLPYCRKLVGKANGRGFYSSREVTRKAENTHRMKVAELRNLRRTTSIS